MADPIPTFYDQNGAQILAANPLDFGNLVKGVVTELPASQFPFLLWNDKGGGSAAKMTGVSITILDATGGTEGECINGTVGNGELPFFLAKSLGSSGCPDDGQAEWTRVGGARVLEVGDIPANASRSIYLKIDTPTDATVGAANIKVAVNYGF